MTSDPLLNEPGITLKHKDNIPFNKIIAYQNINFSIIDMIANENIHSKFKIVNDNIIENYKKNKDDINKIIADLSGKHSDEVVLYTGIYSMTNKICYNTLLKKYESIKKKY